MKAPVGIINYNAGNIGSMVNMFSRIGVDAVVVSDVKELDVVERLVLPGVGHYDHGVRNLKESGMYERLVEHDGRRQPLLGVCLGMQLLMEGSEEGDAAGLGLVPGVCRRFEPGDSGLKVPHMGWSTVTPRGESRQISAQPDDSRYYFVHTYFADPERDEHVAGVSHYITDFCSAVDSGSGVLGYQFHPEKSHRFGMALLKTFVSTPC
jgi:imidazole glycerol-phosphate synthase subunit HisH